MARFLSDANLADFINFVASMGFSGGLIGGTVGWIFRQFDRRFGVESTVDIGDWTVYGGLVGGWLGAVVVGAAMAVR